ncbi:hypothetical protein ACIBF1_23450 [Spirillospora sp. NPDC050679]
MTEEEALRTGALIDLAWRVSRVPGFRTRMDVREVSPFLIIENPGAWGPGRRVTVRTAYARTIWPLSRFGRDAA